MKKYWKELLLGGIVLLIFIPLGVAFSLSFRFIITDTTNGWIGFWGIIGGIITLFVLWKTIRTEKESNDREVKIDYFNNLTCIWTEIVQCIYDTCMHGDRLINENNEKAEIRNNYLESMCIKANQATALCVQLEILLETRKEIYSVKDVLDTVIELREEIEEIFEKLSELKENEKSVDEQRIFLRRKIEDLQEDIPTISNTIKDMVNTNLYS